MEEEITIEEVKVEVNPLIKEIAEKPSPIGSNSLAPGCGALLGLKLALQSIGECVVVTSPGYMTLVYKSINVPFLCVDNPVAAAAAVSEKYPVMVYADECSTRRCLQSFLTLKRRNVIYICYKDQGRSGKSIMLNDIAKNVPSSYSCTASISEIEDYIKKLRKAVEKKGLKFVELFAPSPELMRFDPSNTIEVARMAVETGIWPLYEKDGKLSFTKKLTKLEPVERYTEMLDIKLSEDEIKKLQERAKKIWQIK